MSRLRNFILLFVFAMVISLNANSNVIYKMRATYYIPGHGCGWVTASGDRINLGKLKNFQIRWVALSPDMFREHGFKIGDIVEVITDEKELAGFWVVKDKSAESNRKHIDFLFAKAAKFGTCKVEIRKTNRSEPSEKRKKKKN